jgi:hypothetical protein
LYYFKKDLCLIKFSYYHYVISIIIHSYNQSNLPSSHCAGTFSFIVVGIHNQGDPPPSQEHSLNREKFGAIINLTYLLMLLPEHNMLQLSLKFHVTETNLSG